MSDLNPQQQQAIDYSDGPLLVLAGAGSGKTLVITRKIAHLITHAGIAPEHICAVTFTNKAAREMQNRVSALLRNESTNGLRVSTFHSLGLRIIRNELDTLGYKSGFSIFDTDDSASLLRELLRSDTSGDKELVKKVQWQISQWKNAMLSADQVLIEPGNEPHQSVAARVYAEYAQHLKAYNAVDFDDLILQPLRLFQQHNDILAAWRERIRYLLVDEYQDTNACQYELVKLLVGNRGTLTVVGDDDQSIYAWRGAKSENLQQLQQDFSDLKLIKLEQNYRSMGRILKAANSLIANNPHSFEKNLWSNLGHGDPIRVLHSSSDDEEVERVVTDLRHHMFMHKRRFSDYAILYRSNHQSRLFERALREYRIPYFLSGGTSFFERTEIKNVIAYLRLLCNPDDDNAFLRIVNTPRREIGPVTLEKLGHYAKQRGTSLFQGASELGLEQQLNAKQLARLRQFTDWLAEFAVRSQEDSPTSIAQELLSSIHYDEWLLENSTERKQAQRRQENVVELTNWITRMSKEGETGLDAVINNLMLQNILDNEDKDNTDQVSLMTLHAAKGLEFPHVYIVGMEENILPHHASLSDDALQEERRLAYVGITRAKRTLTFTYANRRKRNGDFIECEASRFLQELPQDELQWSNKNALSDEQKREQGEQCLAGLRELLGGN